MNGPLVLARVNENASSLFPAASMLTVPLAISVSASGSTTEAVAAELAQENESEPQRSE